MSSGLQVACYLYRTILCAALLMISVLLIRSTFLHSESLRGYFGFAGVPYVIVLAFLLICTLPLSFRFDVNSFWLHFALWIYWTLVFLAIVFVVSVISLLAGLNS